MVFQVTEFKYVIIFYFCDAVTSWRHIMTSLNLIHLSQLVDELENWFFFCFHGFLGHWFHTYWWFFIRMMSWHHEVMSWRHSVTLWHTTYANTELMIFLNLSTQKTIETKKNHLASTSTSWDRYSMFNDVMTSFRDVILSCKYDDNIQVEFSYQRNHRNEIESALEHICRLGWRQFVFWRHVVISVTSWRHVMTWKHHASTYTISAWNSGIKIITEIHVYHHFRTSTSWYRRSEFCDIMTSSRHDVMTSCKHKNDNIFELCKPENYGNKKRIISLALLQAEIEYSLFLTPWHDVMTWRHHANTKLTTFLNSATQSFIETKKELSF